MSDFLRYRMAGARVMFCAVFLFCGLISDSGNAQEPAATSDGACVGETEDARPIGNQQAVISSSERNQENDLEMGLVVGHQKPAISPPIVIGFVGGLVRHNDARHSEVELAQRLCALYGNGVRVQVFENNRREDANRTILKWLDSDEDGELSETERSSAIIVLYGHSWGASATLALARELGGEQIPVRLAVEVDSIPKIGQNNRIVPANVAKAVNFYQTHGLLHGTRTISAADPARTKILGNYRYDYKKPPAECSSYPWLARHFTKGQIAIECDVRVWSQVESLIRLEMSRETASGSPATACIGETSSCASAEIPRPARLNVVSLKNF